ncbi:hypothetical protein JTB14_002773 [Gonioctena quinquepunctata]|nr:hypothetical protein JTB14_002773 [Gonioctena quinquepunctata]
MERLISRISVKTDIVTPRIYKLVYSAITKMLVVLSQALPIFRNSVLQCSYDVNIITETWLTKDIGNDESSIANFSTHKCDESCYTSEKKRYGGTLSIIHNEPSPRLIETNSQVVQCYAESRRGSETFVKGGIHRTYIPTNISNIAVKSSI